MILSLVGLVCGLLVVFTGGIWHVILVNNVVDGTGVMLIVAGALLGRRAVWKAHVRGGPTESRRMIVAGRVSESGRSCSPRI
ncbi:hypothetical protein GCM10009803_28890 [Microbacterium ginsengiterrae]